MKIVGWTEWDNGQYKERFPFGSAFSWDDVIETQKVISDEIRERGYKFTGAYHQNGDFGVPIFDDGTVYQCSQRTWGGVVADAYPEEITDKKLAYTKWAWIEPEGETSVLPSPSDYEEG